MIHISSRVALQDDEVELRAVRSQGSGGQNVNKVATAIHLFFDIESSSLPANIKEKLLSKSDQRITKEGVVVIKAQESRTQEANRELAINRLRDMIKEVATPRKKRRPTRPTKGSKERRLKSKNLRSRTKSLRGKVSD